MLILVNKAIAISGEAGVFHPNAEEIYSVVHEGATVIRGTPVFADDFKRTGVDFSRFTGDAFVELTPCHQSEHPAIHVSVSCRNASVAVPVPLIGQEFADYGCDGKTWIPLSPGTQQAIAELLGPLTADGNITLKKYFDATAKNNKVVTLIDSVPRMLEDSKLVFAPSVAVPNAFQGNLYPYQATGFRWLSYIVDQNLPGCLLADEMGLGKTVQIICTLLACRERGLDKPSLIVAPATLLENWRREFGKFAPSVVPLIHRGSNRAGLAVSLAGEAIVVTSYETLLSDISMFREIDWGLVILDEAQAIKNPDARRSRELKTLRRGAAIAVTGTPVENRLADLWSISDFLLPGRLGTRDEFRRLHPDTADGAASLEPRVTPFILRRLVADVATDLPERIEIPQAVELDDESVAAYEAIRAEADPNVRGSALATLQRLRIFCAHPWLVDRLKEGQNPVACSNKLARTYEIVEEIAERKQKVLLFTSFLEMSDLLAKSLSAKFGMPVWQIDGRTPVPERQQIVDNFSIIEGAAALVLNPRAAGTGLNIVAANHVIHFNLEWNPAVEDQASARSYRRGQTRPVTIHRLFYSNTVEDFISDKSTAKRELANSSVIGSDGSSLDASEIIKALSISPRTKSND